MQDLISDRFKQAELLGKKANIAGDLASTFIKDTQMFQNLTGGDDVTVQCKFGHPFQMTNAAKLIFGANKLPTVSLNDTAYYSRWIIIPVDRTFLGKEDSRTEDYIKSSEMSGVLNWALQGLCRLRKNNWHFSEHMSGTEKYLKTSNPEIEFLEDMYEADEDSFVVKNDLIKAYNKWAKEHGLATAPSKKAFGSFMIDQTVIPVETVHPSSKGRQVEAWSGIKAKSIASDTP